MLAYALHSWHQVRDYLCTVHSITGTSNAVALVCCICSAVYLQQCTLLLVEVIASAATIARSGVATK
jgi:hypothetical protein